MVHELGSKKLKIEENIWLTLLNKVINEITNVPSKEILIQADTKARSKYKPKFLIMSNKQIDTNIHCSHKPYPSGTVCQKH